MAKVYLIKGTLHKPGDLEVSTISWRVVKVPFWKSLLKVVKEYQEGLEKVYPGYYLNVTDIRRVD